MPQKPAYKKTTKTTMKNRRRFSWQDSANDMLLTAIHVIAHTKHKQKQGDKAKKYKFLRSFYTAGGDV